jgi:hypothetical protein
VQPAPHANAGSPAHIQKAGFLGYIGEGAIAIVLVRAVRRAFRRAVHARAAEQENIHPTVIVIVEKSAAATCGFQNVVFVIGGAVDHGCDQARLSRDIGEVRVEGAAGGSELGLSFYIPGRDTLSQRLCGAETERQGDKTAASNAHKELWFR